MAKLSSLQCPKCKRVVESLEFVPNAKRQAPTASSYDTCLRRCDSCGISWSNAASVENSVRIYRNPLDNIPEPVREGAIETLSKAVNIRNRTNKLAKFGFENSEDAVTWTVFRYLQQSNVLAETFRSLLAQGPAVQCSPSLLIWGVPVPAGNAYAIEIAARLNAISDALKENPSYRSEPDVIVDLGASGIVVIEVKYRSPNEFVRRGGWDWRYYLHSSAFDNSKNIEESGMYELARNWRIAWELGKATRSTLINLGPTRLFEGDEGQKLDRFVSGLRQDMSHSFIKLTWWDFFSHIPQEPRWFADFIDSRGL
ncbi:MAG: hypothetical protein L6437_16625 [Kiritimatiellae bacterium]|nr:hypothetical protein [Kiritimatiellia bacterium]